ncbi:MAG: M42 family metallopeptidase [Bacteroidota bacterium]|nr:M42 family metallopeptidase [Bacteroidota bacterium]
MKIENFKLLKQLSETAGAPGFEARVRQLIKSEGEKYVDNVSIDNMGNLTLYKKGHSNQKIMLAAHMDEIGFMVTHIDKNGFIRFQPLGGFDPKTVVSQRVVIHGKEDIYGVVSSKPIHIMSPEERKQNPKLKDFFIDTGRTQEELNQIIETGNPITRDATCIQMGNCVNGKSMDNRISVFILLEVLRELKDIRLPYDVHAVFSVQEEVGLRGVQTATLGIQPDFAFAVDTTIAYDLPGAAEHESVSKLGEGVAIKLMDAGVIADYRMVKFMRETAKSNKIKYQAEALPAGGTDTARMQQFVKHGSIAGAFSIPTRHLHQTIESVHGEDIKSSIELIKACLQEIDSFDWTHD